MNAQSEVSTFLTSRRARLNPHDVGIVLHDGRRRVPGLRREEVAILAGISVDYYGRIERGQAGAVSTDVVASVARALRLSDAESAHLSNLLSDERGIGSPLAEVREVRPALQRILDALDAPAWIRNGRLDLLAYNARARALLPGFVASPYAPVNIARYMFLDPSAREFFVDWHGAARKAAAGLRMEVGRHPKDGRLDALIGELTEASREFARIWSLCEVDSHLSGNKRFFHPLLGVLTVEFEAMGLPADPDLTLHTYASVMTEAGEDALPLLDRWADEAAGAAGA